MKPAEDRTFIIGRFSDYLFLIYSPLLAIALAWIWQSSDLRISFAPVGIRYKNTFLQFFVAVFTYAHIVLIFVRTHLNAQIFSQYRLRFTLVPAVLFATLFSSNSLAIVGAVIVSLWDVYHSSLQTFGLARIYDAREGNDPEVGRLADRLISLLLYVGPIVGGAVLVDHLRYVAALGQIGPVFFEQVPAMGASWSGALSRLVIGVTLPAVVLYVAHCLRLAAAGYRVSPKKVALLASTALCSIIAWGLNPWGKAFFIMNFFHALQYFAIVWWSEKKNIIARLRLTDSLVGLALAFGVFLVVSFAAGIVLELGSNNYNSRVIYCLAVTCSLMHFWADGFVWSVRKKQV